MTYACMLSMDRRIDSTYNAMYYSTYLIYTAAGLLGIKLRAINWCNSRMKLNER